MMNRPVLTAFLIACLLVVGARIGSGPAAADTCGTPLSAVPTSTTYLPNVTKTLGGPTGWQTPFIVQNTGSLTTDLEVSFYRFSDGSCVVRRIITNVMPGTSYADVPNNDTDLPDNGQFSVVVRSFGAKIVSVVNEHQGTGARAEAMAYDAFNSGATTVYLPNVVRRFFGFVTPFVIQNLGTNTDTVTATFVSFDGSVPTVTITRLIASGRSQFVDPNSEAGLVDGKQYSVTVTAPEPIAVVVNSHQDSANIAAPLAYSTDGISAGAATVYGPYAAKNAGGVGRVSTIVVQNVGATAATPSIGFVALAGSGGQDQTVTSSVAIAPGAAWAFDPRFAFGTTTPCSGASSTCLGDGEYSFVATAAGGRVAAIVNIISSATAMGYTASPSPSGRVFLPNITRTLGGSDGWTTPILLQSATATGATLKWYRFSDGQLAFIQTVAIPAGRGIRVDPRDVTGLADNAQYSVVAEGTGGTIVAVVTELAAGGDNAMAYEGFPDSP